MKLYTVCTQNTYFRASKISVQEKFLKILLFLKFLKYNISCPFRALCAYPIILKSLNKGLSITRATSAHSLLNSLREEGERICFAMCPKVNNSGFWWIQWGQRGVTSKNQGYPVAYISYSPSYLLKQVR